MASLAGLTKSSHSFETPSTNYAKALLKIQLLFLSPLLSLVGLTDQREGAPMCFINGFKTQGAPGHKVVSMGMSLTCLLTIFTLKGHMHGKCVLGFLLGA